MTYTAWINLLHIQGTTGRLFCLACVRQVKCANFYPNKKSATTITTLYTHSIMPDHKVIQRVPIKVYQSKEAEGEEQ